MPSLTLEFPPGQKRQFTIHGQIVTVGRKPDNDIVIPEPFVSGRHAEFRLLPDGTYVLSDLKSHNGTLVNGQRAENTKLRDGDRLLFGAVEARFSLADAPAAAPVAVPVPAVPTVPSTRPLPAVGSPNTAPSTDTSTVALMAPTQRIRPAAATPAPLQPPGQELAKVGQQLKAAREELLTVQRQVASAKAQAEAAQSENAAARTELEAARQELSLHRAELDPLVGRLQTIRSEVSAAEDRAKSIVSAAEDRAKSLTAAAEQARRDADSRRQELQAAEARYRELHESTEILRRQEQGLTERLQTLHRQQFLLEQRMRATLSASAPISEQLSSTETAPAGA